MLHLHKVYKGACTIYCCRVLSLITDPAVTDSYQTYYYRLSTVFADCPLLILNLVRYSAIIGYLLRFLVSIGVLPSGFVMCYILCPLLKCIFSSARTSQTTRSTLNCFFGLGLVPTETRSVTHTKGVTHSHFGYIGEIIAHSGCGRDSLSLAAWRQ